jgi:hypothetical protein
MMLPGSNTSARNSWRILLALLCVVLVVASATVELTHSHADGHHADCALCATAHVVIQTAVVAALVVFFALVATVTRSARLSRCVRLTIFALFTRPPPACIAAV